MPRAVKQTKIYYDQMADGSLQKKVQAVVKQTQQRQRSRQKQQIKQNQQKTKLENKSSIVKVDMDRRAKLLAMRKKNMQQSVQQKSNTGQIKQGQNKGINVVVNKDQQKEVVQQDQEKQTISINIKQQPNENKTKQKKQNEVEQQNSEEVQDENFQKQRNVLYKPVFIDSKNRQGITNQQSIINSEDQIAKQQQRRKRAIRHTTKILLNMQNQDISDSENENSDNNSSGDQMTKLPNDDDNVNEEYEYELWKIRELKRIRRDQQQRQKATMQKAELDRRRKMNNQEIMLDNRMLGSDLTDNAEKAQTKYVYMQQYYHKGAFYQDSQDQIFKRDYNLPTPLQMQDKSILPEIMQKRKGKFGMKGQTKYTHLSNEDTTNFDPLYRPDQAILNQWKKKTGGYKSNHNRNI